MIEPLCGCGRSARYNHQKVGETEPVMACNKYMRCSTYEELSDRCAQRYRETVALQAENERLKESNRYALATFRALVKMSVGQSHERIDMSNGLRSGKDMLPTGAQIQRATRDCLVGLGAIVAILLLLGVMWLLGVILVTPRP